MADAAARTTETAVQNAAFALSDADTCIAVKIADVQLISVRVGSAGSGGKSATGSCGQ